MLGVLRTGGWVVCLGFSALLARDFAELTWQAWRTPDGVQRPRATGLPNARDGEGVNVAGLAALHLFGTAPDSAPAERPTRPPAAGAVRLGLGGVYLSEAPGETRAYIRADDGSLGIYRLNQPLPGGGRIVEAHPDWVVVERAGVRETLRLERTGAAAGGPGAAAPRPAAAHRIIVNNRANRRIARDLKAWQARLRERPEALLGLLAVSPVSEGDVLTGFRLLPGSEDGLLRRLGLSPGDIVVNVNGTPLDTLERGIDALRGLASARDITLEVVRGDKELVFRYRVGS